LRFGALRTPRQPIASVTQTPDASKRITPVNKKLTYSVTVDPFPRRHPLPPSEASALE